jgi:hypothetical protein
MAGLSKRFCREACPYKDDPSIKGLCGACSGKAYPCDVAEENCGKWQNADCLREDGVCGDGHDCPRYIDIEFTLNAFAIQGKTCCNANGYAIAQQCDGASQNNETPLDAPPLAWSASENGETEYVIYEKTEHQIRLTRSDCGCHWGGYWSSQCDCNTCCCTNHQGGDSEAGDCTLEDIYPTCDDCYTMACLPSYGTCVDDSGDSCRPCDPSIPCYPADDGYASSLDRFGSGNIGTSDGQALCTLQSGASDSGFSDPCDNISTDCDGWVAAGTPARACWNCGLFKSHHIQAYFTFNDAADNPDENCNTNWAFSIRGMTDLTATELGNRTSPSLDCYSHGTGNVCNHLPSSGGTAEGCMGYIGYWEGTTLSGSTNCTACDPRIDAHPTDELVFHSCGCPPATEIDSTVRVTDSSSAFHPSAVCGNRGGVASMFTCVVKDSEGSQPSETWCNNDDGAIGRAVCIDKETDASLGVCYGSPQLWKSECRYCGGVLGCCDDNWDTGCDDPCYCGEGNECDCIIPTGAFSTLGVSEYVQPCSHCIDGIDPNDLNHPSCIPCEDIAGESRVCAPCHIKIVPNNSPVPSWHKST